MRYHVLQHDRVYSTPPKIFSGEQEQRRYLSKELAWWDTTGNYQEMWKTTCFAMEAMG